MRKASLVTLFSMLLAGVGNTSAKDYFIVAGGRMETTCGTMQFALETASSSGVRVSRLSAGGGITGQQPMPLFEITLFNTAGERQTLRSDEGWQQVKWHKKSSNSCIIQFSRTMPSTGQLALSVQVQLMTDEERQESHLMFTWADCQIPTNWTLERTTLLPLYFGSLPEDTQFFYPYCSGMVCNPTKDAIERNISYPGGFYASMGWYALYNKEGGIYYAAHDPKATVKQLYMKTTPGQGLEMWFDYPATAPKGKQAMPADANIVLAPLHGDWFDGAMRYRDWVRREANWYPREKMGPKGRTDTPQWMKELSLWVNGVPDLVKTFKRSIGVPMGLHWYCWHTIPFDNDYPHYFPARPGFQETVSDLQTSGIYVMPYINGRLWDTRDDGTRDSLFTSIAKPAVTKLRDGSIYTERYESKEADGSDVWLGVMCPQTDVWRNKMKEVVLGLCGPVAQGGCGTRAVYMDQIAAAHPICCYDDSHGHPLGGGSWWTEAYRGMMANIRSAKPAGVALTTESNADGYVDLFDGFLVWQFWHNGQVPAFGAVYGGSIQLFGRNYVSTDPIDFKMTLAQSFVWGEQLGWFSTDILSNLPRNSSIFPFLRQVVWLRNQFSSYFYMGEMARAPRLTGENPILTAHWQSGTVEYPAVMCGAWTIPSQNKTLLLFANYSTEDVQLGLECPLKEWGFEEGGYEVTRYNSNGIRTALDSLPSKLVFHSDEAFVLELTSQNSSYIKTGQIMPMLQKVYYDLCGRKSRSGQKGIRITKDKKVLVK